MPTTEAAASDFQYQDPPIASQLRAALKSACGGREESLFAMLDGARIPKLWAMLRELNVEHAPLFRPSPKENILHVTPFLTRVQPSGDLSMWMALQPEVLESAVFLVSPASLADIYRHFRRFLLVRDVYRRSVYLRFYDPRVLASFLTVSNEVEKRRFFGPVDRFFCYDQEASNETDNVRFRSWKLTEEQSQIAIPAPPDTHQPFELRAEHDTEFAKTAMENYERRCIGYLRENYRDRLKDQTDETVLGFIQEAKQLGPTMGLPSGRDATHLAELIVLGWSDDMKQRILGLPEKDRSRAVVVLRDRLAKPEEQ